MGMTTRRPRVSPAQRHASGRTRAAKPSSSTSSSQANLSLLLFLLPRTTGLRAYDAPGGAGAMGARMDLERITRDGYALHRVLGAERKAAQQFITTHHYGQSDGGSGYLYAAIAPDGSIAGACLIGPASSMAAERAILDPPWRVWTCKRLVCLDSCPVPESQLLWYALRQTANQLGSTFGCVSYADPA